MKIKQPKPLQGLYEAYLKQITQSVVIEILSFRHKNFTTLQNRIDFTFLFS